MKGWVTADPLEVIEIVSRFGRLRVLDDKDLVIEFEKTEDLQNLQRALSQVFGGEVDVEEIVKASPPQKKG
jgi:predicted nucleotidyltransferase